MRASSGCGRDMGTFDLTSPAAPSGLCPVSPLPTGVLENSTTKDRPAVQKAKVLYHSCMNESEWPKELPRQDPVPGPHGPETEHGGVGASPKSCRWELCAPPGWPPGPRCPTGSRLTASCPGPAHTLTPASHTVPRENAHAHACVCARACVWFEGNIIQDAW